MAAPNIETIVSLAKRRGFVFPSSEIYGGLGSSWDYGPLGVELCNNVKQNWWRWMVHERDDMEGIDSSIILNPLVWRYSGHEATFNDPLVDCRKCKSRFRADKLQEDGDWRGALTWHRILDAIERLQARVPAEGEKVPLKRPGLRQADHAFRRGSTLPPIGTAPTWRDPVHVRTRGLSFPVPTGCHLALLIPETRLNGRRRRRRRTGRRCIDELPRLPR